jgi:DNA-binding GntR family transcriptional regulator
MFMSKESLKDIVYNYLFDCIVSYKLLPGEAIVEQEISNHLKISRTPVREALKKLEAEGLVRHFPARGTFVEELTTQDVEEIFELRELFEVAAIKVSIHTIPIDEIKELERFISDLKYEESCSEDFYRSDRILHNLIVEYGGNRRMVNFFNTINTQLERFRRISAMTPKRLEKSKQEHLQIIEAIKERDTEKAIAVLHVHLNNIEMNTLDVCQKVRVTHSYSRC